MVSLKSCMCSLIVLAPFLAANLCLAVTADVPDQILSPAEDVKARVDVTGKVGVESDLSGSSSMQTADAEGHIPIGPAKSPGIYFVRLFAADKTSSTICVLITDAPDNKLKAMLVALGDLNPAKSSPVDSTLIARFADAVSKDHYAAAASASRKVLREWLPKHVVETSGTVTICILPGAQAFCVARIGNQLVDLGFEFADALIDECKLTDADKEKVRRWLQGGRSVVDLVKIAKGDGAVDRLISAVSAGVNVTEFAVKEEGGNDMIVSVVGNNFVGLVDKTAVTIKILTK